MIALGAFRATFASIEVAREQVNRLFDIVQKALAKSWGPNDLHGAFTELTNGAVTVTMTNAPTGTATTPPRYVTFDDGKGGRYTFASLT